MTPVAAFASKAAERWMWHLWPDWRDWPAYSVSSPLVPMPIRRGVLALLGHRFGADTRVRPGTIIQGRRLTVGVDVLINRGCTIEAVGAITIGDEAGLGPDVLVLTVTHQIGQPGRRAGDRATAPVTIGPGSWIGARSTLLPGVTVGAGAVVAAGAIVASDVPANTLVAGVPARVLRTLDGAQSS